MQNPIKNQNTEELAQKIAKAIREENTAEYSSLMGTEVKNLFEKMVRWESLAFRDRVHFLVNNP